MCMEGVWAFRLVLGLYHRGQVGATKVFNENFRRFINLLWYHVVSIRRRLLHRR